MKKILFILGIVIILTGLGGVAYWYWQKSTGTPALQIITLDNPGIKSFDDICKPDTGDKLNCGGNIQQFNCNSLNETNFNFMNIQPNYPMIICEEKVQYQDSSESGSGVYIVEGEGLLSGRITPFDYIIIKDGVFQLIESENQFHQLFQPIESVAEAAAYFQALHKAVLVFDENTLNSLKNSSAGEYIIAPQEMILNSVNETVDGFTITAYSEKTLSCKTDLYNYTFLLERNGNIIEQSKILVWHSDLECTS